MNEQMEFPETFEKFAKEYGFKDAMQVYTNGSDLIPVFRVKQWIEHNNKLHAIETDTGKQIPFDDQESKTEALDKIRAEIDGAKMPKNRMCFFRDGIECAMEIIDKYRTESEVQDEDSN